MHVALTAWEDRVSPVFDAASRLLVVDINAFVISDRRYVNFNPEKLAEVIDLLKALEISVLICGAISEGPAAQIETLGIQLIPFISGTIDDVLACLVNGNSIIPGFLMPGCNRMRCCRGKIINFSPKRLKKRSKL